MAAVGRPFVVASRVEACERYTYCYIIIIILIYIYVFMSVCVLLYTTPLFCIISLFVLSCPFLFTMELMTRSEPINLKTPLVAPRALSIRGSLVLHPQCRKKRTPINAFCSWCDLHFIMQAGMHHPKNANLGKARQGTNRSPLFQCLDVVAHAALGQNC